MGRGISEFILNDYEDEYAPPEKPVLSVSVVDDVVFLAINKSTEGFDHGEYTTVAQIGVDTRSLILGLLASEAAWQ
jgi:hypothetical protein